MQFLSYRNRRLALAAATALVLGLVAFVPAPAEAGHDFDVSEGVYRIPYADGTSVTVSNDHHDHSPAQDRIDMSAGLGESLVAAASGWIRAIVDFNGGTPNAGDGVDKNGDPQSDDLEDNCSGDGDVVVGSCSDYNNYVWIEHPNGEWSKISHVGTGTVSDHLSVGDWVDAGDFIGEEAHVGAANGSHLHWEVGIPSDPNDPTPFSTLGGFLQGNNVVGLICDIPDNLFESGESYTADPCTNNQPPTADAGGPYDVDEGSDVQLDGTGSSDPEGNPLTYLWVPDTNLDDASLAQPTYSGVDDEVAPITLSVFDQVEALDDTDATSVTVHNVAPLVIAVGDSIDEGSSATVSATFTDPGVLDTHTATIDWDDGTPPENVAVVQGAGSGSLGASHVYGDNATYNVTVTVTDDDGGVGVDVASVIVANLDPALTLDTGDAVSFPGGDYFVGQIGKPQTHAASAQDAGSDDLTFSWGFGPATTYFNDGIAPDPPKSPHGVFPFFAADDAEVDFVLPGVYLIDVTVTDDDGGSDAGSLGKVVTGDADTTEGIGWWKHQYSGGGNPHVDDAFLEGYLDIVNAVSSVFSEATPVSTLDDVHVVLSPIGGDRRIHAEGDLMAAWLSFASGAVAWDASVPLEGGGAMGFLDLMLQVETTILDGAATDQELLEAELLAQRVRHAG